MLLQAKQAKQTKNVKHKCILSNYYCIPVNDNLTTYELKTLEKAASIQPNPTFMEKAINENNRKRVALAKQKGLPLPKLRNIQEQKPIRCFQYVNYANDLIDDTLDVDSSKSNSMPAGSTASNISSIRFIEIPRAFGIRKYGINPETTEIHLSQGRPMKAGIQMDPSFVLDEKGRQQVSATSRCMKELKRDLGAVLIAPTGTGKTQMGIFLMMQFKVKTLWIQHTSDLLSQSMERVKSLVPGIRVGIIQGQICDTVGKDIVFCTVQTLALKIREMETAALALEPEAVTMSTPKDESECMFSELDALGSGSEDETPIERPKKKAKKPMAILPDDFFDQFGMTVIDEVHHYAASTFSRVSQKMRSMWKLGLSATPKRKDGLEDLIYWTIGPKVEIKVERVVDVYADIYQYEGYYREAPSLVDKSRSPVTLTESLQSLCVSKKKAPSAKIADDGTAANGTAITDITNNCVQTIRSDYKLRRECRMYNNPNGLLNRAEMLKNLMEDEARNSFIVKKLIQLWIYAPHRRVLVLSTRVAHVKLLREMFVSRLNGVADYFIGRELKFALTNVRELKFALTNVKESKKSEPIDTSNIVEIVTEYVSWNCENDTSIYCSEENQKRKTKTSTKAPRKRKQSDDVKKNIDLKPLERRIIFASNKMAEEGLDLREHNTLLFALPGDNIVQCCGRILRKAYTAVPLDAEEVLPSASASVLKGQGLIRAQAPKQVAATATANNNIFTFSSPTSTTPVSKTAAVSTTPTSNTLSPYEQTFHPLVIDITDNFSLFHGIGRKGIYNEQKYIINTKNCSDSVFLY